MVLGGKALLRFEVGEVTVGGTHAVSQHCALVSVLFRRGEGGNRSRKGLLEDDDFPDVVGEVIDDLLFVPVVRLKLDEIGIDSAIKFEGGRLPGDSRAGAMVAFLAGTVKLAEPERVFFEPPFDVL